MLPNGVAGTWRMSKVLKFFVRSSDQTRFLDLEVRRLATTRMSWEVIMELKTLKDLRDFVGSIKGLPDDYLLVVGVPGIRTGAGSQSINQYVASVGITEAYGGYEVVLIEGSGDAFWK